MLKIYVTNLGKYNEGFLIGKWLELPADVMIYSNCSNMSEVAEEYADQVGLLESIPEELRYYFDFEAYGRDMEIEGNFVFTDSGNCIQIF